MSISVVIPALNEERGIAGVVKACKKFALETVVVDGNSTDYTARVAAEAGAKVCVQPIRGYGLSLMTGFKECTGDIIATLDGDGTYPAFLIPSLAQMLEAQGWQFISGSRFPISNQYSMNSINYIGNWCLTRLASFLWLYPFKDILSGMWVFKRSCLNRLSLFSRKWDLSQEIKIEAMSNFYYGFQEIHIPYYSRAGATKLSPLKVGVENTVFFIAHRFGFRKLLFPQGPFLCST